MLRANRSKSDTQFVQNAMSLSEMLSKYSKESSHLIVCVQASDSPVGRIIAAADKNHIYIVAVEDTKKFEIMFQTLADHIQCKFIEKKNKILETFENELADYFKGNLQKFTVPIKTYGSEFQKEVWCYLQKLPYASTQTYGDIAKAMGRQSSHARAVGAACGANAHLLVIPCHRVVASGSRGGFTSGLDRKEWLLNHEKKNFT